MENEGHKPRHAEFLAGYQWSRDHVLREHPVAQYAAELGPRIDRSLQRAAQEMHGEKMDVRSQIQRITKAPSGAGLPYSHIVTYLHHGRGPSGQSTTGGSAWGLSIEGHKTREQMLHFTEAPHEDPEFTHYLGEEQGRYGEYKRPPTDPNRFS